jgi:hypothetical protein
MIDLALTSLEFPSEWVAIPAVSEGEGLHPRSTLRIGDLLLHLPIKREASKSYSCSVAYLEREKKLVGRDITIDELYPDLWGDLCWVDPDDL